MKITLKLIIAFLFSLSAMQVSASHLMGGNITYTCNGNNAYTFKTELYRDCNGVTLGNSITLNVSSVSCGQSFTTTLQLTASGGQIVTPLCTTEPDLCNGSGTYGVQRYTYESASVTLPSNCTDWVISYNNCCRNMAVTTLANASASSFYIQTKLNNVAVNCNNSPSFGFDPLLYACLGDTAYYSHGVSEVDGDSLSFSLIPCTGTNGTALSYSSGYSATSPLSTSYIQLNSTTGTLKFVPTISQVGVICMLVEEYRNGVKISAIVRDVQISITNCGANQPPVLSGINGTANASGTTGANTISTCAGQNLCFTIDAYDVNTAQTIGLNYTNSLQGATYTINTTGNTAQVTICWTPSVSNMGANHFGLSVYDNTCPLRGKSNYSYIVNVTGASGSAAFNNVTIPLGGSVAIPVTYANQNCVVTWAASPSLSCTNCSSPVASPTTTTTYYYQVNCPGGCAINSDSVVVNVLQPVTIQGTISRHDGQPLDNSKVYVFVGIGNIVDSSFTDAAGHYSITSTATSLVLSAVPNSTHFDQKTTYYNGGINYFAATPIVLNAGPSMTVNFATLPKPKTLTGTITRYDGQPLDNSDVYLLDNTQNVIDSTMTNGSGSYTFTTTANNLYLLAVPNTTTHSSQAPTLYDGTIDPLTATMITFTTLQATASFSTLPSSPVIIGTITRADGAPLNNSWVHLIDTSMNQVDSVLTTAQGDYLFMNLDATIHYYIKATPGSTHGDQVITYYDGAEAIQAADSITMDYLINVANYSTIDTASATGLKSISGTVGLGTDNFTPLANVRLFLKDNSGNFINDAITDDNGEFSFYGLSEGNYTVFVDKVGIDNELAPMVNLASNEPAKDSLVFLLHSYYLEMLTPNSTTEILKVQNILTYPNPVAALLSIQYDLETTANVQISILDISGKVVENLINERQMAGKYQITQDFSKNKLIDGIYFLRFQFDNQIVTKEIIIKQ